MGGIVNLVVLILALLWALIQAVESPGGGEEKRATVLDKMGGILAALPLPGWARLLFANPLVLGVLVDLLVETAKRNQWFASIPDIAVAIGEPG
jgi:hypothetical protein